jgi:hypothetical protein
MNAENTATEHSKIARMLKIPDMRLAYQGSCVGGKGGGKQSFFEKKDQKTFIHKTFCGKEASKTKVFGSFFQKRTASLPRRLSLRSASPGPREQ